MTKRKTRLAGIVHDRRGGVGEGKKYTAGSVKTTGRFVVCTDRYMSGWGIAQGGRSLYALDVGHAKGVAQTVLRNAQDRGEMKRCRITSKLPRLGKNDHLSIVDRSMARAWYSPKRPFKPQKTRKRK